MELPIGAKKRRAAMTATRLSHNRISGSTVTRTDALTRRNQFSPIVVLVSPGQTLPEVSSFSKGDAVTDAVGSSRPASGFQSLFLISQPIRIVTVR